MKKLERKMSETVIFGSWEIWRNNAKHIDRGNREEVNQLIAEEERSMEEAEAELQRESQGKWREQNPDGSGRRVDEWSRRRCGRL
jgi:hypothetical protein